VAQITGKQIFQMLDNGVVPPRVPFCPTIFEHAAKVINVTPSQLAKSLDLIVAGQLAAYEIYAHDLISVAVDIYNVQAEAIGSEIIFRDDDSVPAINGILITEEGDFKNLTIPNPEKDGRMPIFVEACQIINAKIGEEVNVIGNIVGPFTLAAQLRGYENFIFDINTNEKFAFELLSFSVEVATIYAKAYIEKGLSVAVSESWIAPPLLSPRIYQDKILKFHQELIKNLKKLGQKNVALISGGDTFSIAEQLVCTGSSILVADFNTNQPAYKSLCESRGITLRANIDSRTVEIGNPLEMENAVKHLYESCANGGRFIFGCGVISYNTDPENIKQLKRLVEKHNPYQ
jgi:uroporphyrinogen decarboxylase